MMTQVRAFLSLFVSLCLVCYSLPTLALARGFPQVSSSPPPLDELVEGSYVDLFEKAPGWEISPDSIEAFRKTLEGERDREEDSLEDQQHSIERQIEKSQDDLKNLNRSTSQAAEVEKKRHEIHCRVQKLRKNLEETRLALQRGLDIKYENKLAKLRILQEWPGTYRNVLQMKESGKAVERKFGDFRDVGFRNGTFKDQQEDVKTGREAIEEMKQQGLMPPEVEDEQVKEYISSLASRIARHSDLRVPLNVTVLKSREINAFAIPGGFLFINTGLVDQAENESQLAGVIAHEMAHVSARHGHRLMSKANIAGIIFQAAQLAALIFTGGVASIGTYYALQYGFYGLGLVLSLSLLGVSRDYETEADILGTQYLWHAGYDTRGFISFFEKMAQEEGYVTGLSWFRTHPPFYERMEATFKEITLLPEQEEPIRDASEFHEAKERLAGVMKEMEKQDKEAPTLRVVYHCEDQP